MGSHLDDLWGMWMDVRMVWVLAELRATHLECLVAGLLAIQMGLALADQKAMM